MALSSNTKSSPIGEDGGTTSIAAVHSDIVVTQVFTRLDGPSLAVASSASSLLYSLISSDEKLWRDACHATWPSTTYPLLRRCIDAFPSRHRAFFSDSFPLLHHHHNNTTTTAADLRLPTKLISAVDIHYNGTHVFSEAMETKTDSKDWFGSAPFRIDMLENGGGSRSGSDPVVVVPEKFDRRTCARKLEDNLRVSWILTDPTLNRAANLSTRKPVSVGLRRRWTSSSLSSGGDVVEVRYSTVVRGDGEKGSASELVEVAVVVTCGRGSKEGETHVREVSLKVEDMEGRNLSAEESLVILGDAIRRGERKKMRSERGCCCCGFYEEFVEMRRERRERKERRERVADAACMAIGFSVFFALWCFLLFR